jgi:hypothetical protein
MDPNRDDRLVTSSDRGPDDGRPVGLPDGAYSIGWRWSVWPSSGYRSDVREEATADHAIAGAGYWRRKNREMAFARQFAGPGPDAEVAGRGEAGHHRTLLMSIRSSPNASRR